MIKANVHMAVFLYVIIVERFAMEWVNRHISAFGGDPEKVTM